MRDINSQTAQDKSRAPSVTSSSYDTNQRATLGRVVVVVAIVAALLALNRWLESRDANSDPHVQVPSSPADSASRQGSASPGISGAEPWSEPLDRQIAETQVEETDADSNTEGSTPKESSVFRPTTAQKVNADVGTSGAVQSTKSTNANAASNSSPPTNSKPARSPEIDAAGNKKSPERSRYIVENVTIHDRDRNVIYRDQIDLRETIARIEAGELLSRFPHDGIVFQNRERRLPRQDPGYYHEYVHPTKGVSGPGPQRIVTGKNGEIYYTHDHYSSFRKLK